MLSAAFLATVASEFEPVAVGQNLDGDASHPCWLQSWQDTDNVRLSGMDPTAGFRRRRVCRIGKSR